MIKNVIFDNGGVIVKYSPKTYLNYFGFPAKTQKLLNKLFVSNEWTSFSKGEISSADFKTHAINLLPQFKTEILKILDVDNLKFMIPPYNETLKFIKELREHKYKVFLLTDINEDTITYLNQEIPNFESLFDGIVYSCRVGMVKKDGKVFHKLLIDHSLFPEETLFIDDNTNNLKIAKKYGLLTHKFSNPNKDINKIKRILTKNS